MSDENGSTFATIAAKVPRDLRDSFAALAELRGMTPSALLRRLVELEMAGAPDGDPAGEVERAVRTELELSGADVTSARGATAVNLARRMDRMPAAGAPNAAQLRQLLAELAPVDAIGFDEISWLRLGVAFKRRGWEMIDRDGRQFDVVDVPDEDRRAFIYAMSG